MVKCSKETKFFKKNIFNFILEDQSCNRLVKILLVKTTKSYSLVKDMSIVHTHIVHTHIVHTHAVTLLWGGWNRKTLITTISACKTTFDSHQTHLKLLLTHIPPIYTVIYLTVLTKNIYSMATNELKHCSQGATFWKSWLGRFILTNKYCEGGYNTNTHLWILSWWKNFFPK